MTVPKNAARTMPDARLDDATMPIEHIRTLDNGINDLKRRIICAAKLIAISDGAAERKGGRAEVSAQHYDEAVRMICGESYAAVCLTIEKTRGATADDRAA